MLILLLQVYGIGNWRAIIESDMLPGKRITQMNGQTQRLVGQQSLAGMDRAQLTIAAGISVHTAECLTCAAISRLSVDIDRLRADNEAKTDVRRKGGLIIWTGSACLLVPAIAGQALCMLSAACLCREPHHHHAQPVEG